MIEQMIALEPRRPVEDPRHTFVCDRLGFERMVEEIQSNNRDRSFKFSMLDHIYIDGGGACRMDEPVVEFVAADLRWKMPMNNLPFVRDALTRLGEHPALKGCFGFQCQDWHNIFALSVRIPLLEEVDRLAIAHEPEIRRREEEMAAALKGAGIRNFRKCSCQSGKEYLACCGAGR